MQSVTDDLTRQERIVEAVICLAAAAEQLDRHADTSNADFAVECAVVLARKALKYLGG